MDVSLGNVPALVPQGHRDQIIGYFCIGQRRRVKMTGPMRRDPSLLRSLPQFQNVGGTVQTYLASIYPADVVIRQRIIVVIDNIHI